MSQEARPDPVALLTAAVGAGRDPDRVGQELLASVEALPDEDREAVLLAALRSALPVTEQWLLARGVHPADVTAGLADVDRKVERYGFGGVGLDWLVAVVTARVVMVGRLQFELGEQLPDGTPAWGVHIPETGPLEPDACDRAFAAAPAVLERLWDEPRPDRWSCGSWVLDPGLSAVLGPEANLSRFAARFRLVPDSDDAAGHGDADIAKFVFGTSLEVARAARPVGRVQRAVHERWAAGAQWRSPTGWAPIE